MSTSEQTLSIIKPDAVERNLEVNITNIFINSGLKIINKKKYIFQKMKHQAFMRCINQNLFNDLCNYLSSGPIIVMILEGENAVKKIRNYGVNRSKNGCPNTIRKLYGISIDKNSVHGSDSLDNAKKK